VIHVYQPSVYHLNPTAPQRYTMTLDQGDTALKTPVTGKGLTLPIRVPVTLAAGSATARVSFTFVYCREDNTGTCRIKTLQWQAPVEVVSDGSAPSEITLSAKVE